MLCGFSLYYNWLLSLLCSFLFALVYFMCGRGAIKWGPDWLLSWKVVWEAWLIMTIIFSGVTHVVYTLDYKTRCVDWRLLGLFLPSIYSSIVSSSSGTVTTCIIFFYLQLWPQNILADFRVGFTFYLKRNAPQPVFYKVSFWILAPRLPFMWMRGSRVHSFFAISLCFHRLSHTLLLLHLQKGGERKQRGELC